MKPGSNAEFGYGHLLENGTESTVTPETKIEELVGLFAKCVGDLEEASRCEDDPNLSRQRDRLISEAKDAENKFRASFANLSPAEQKRCVHAIEVEARAGNLEPRLKIFLTDNADLIKAR